MDIRGAAKGKEQEKPKMSPYHKYFCVACRDNVNLETCLWPS